MSKNLGYYLFFKNAKNKYQPCIVNLWIIYIEMFLGYPENNVDTSN